MNFVKRRYHVRLKCKADDYRMVKQGTLSRKTLRNIYVNDEYGFMYCSTPKVE